MFPKRLVPFLVALHIVFLVGCGSGEGEAPVAGADVANEATEATEADVADETDELSERERVARLRSLPYADVVAPEDAKEGKGVVLWDEERAWPGVNIFSTRRLCKAELFDMDGTVVNTWEEPGCRFWSNAELRPNGSLLVVGADAKRDEERFLKLFGADGEIIWTKKIPAHHDMEFEDDGTILALGLEYREYELEGEMKTIRDDLVMHLSPEGEILETWSLTDALFHEDSELEPIPAKEKDEWGPKHVDLIHANSIERMREEELFGTHPLYSPDHVLVCSRHQDVAAIVDLESGRAEWVWGRGEISGPHDAQLLPSGNILIFDNGLAEERSRLLEVDPRTDEIVWSYEADEPSSFFTESKGSVQKLPNGNYLVANSNSGQAFEITPDGDVVWEFLNADPSDETRKLTFFRIRRHAYDWFRLDP